MRILFDQATPLPIRGYLDGHTISTAIREGWDKLRNGDLLAAAEEAGTFPALNSRLWIRRETRSWRADFASLFGSISFKISTYVQTRISD